MFGFMGIPLIRGLNKKYRLVLIGSGWWGTNILREAVASGTVDVVGICDVDQRALKKCAEEIKSWNGGTPKWYTDYRECVRLQEATWGEGFSERVSTAILKVAQRIGGVASGAYDESGALSGFVFGMTGWRDGYPVHWSDMLAVRSELRNSGLGRALKWHQRRLLLDLGVKTMYWTFDPLESRNAYLNLNRLGTVVRQYEMDMYGDTDSPLHSGIGTDRFVPVWEMDSDRVQACWEIENARRGAEDEAAAGACPEIRALGIEAPHVPAALGFELVDGVPHPSEPDLDRDEQALAVSIPADIQGLRAVSLEAAVAWRSATRVVFTDYVARGYEILELERGTPCSRYLMFRP